MTTVETQQGKFLYLRDLAPRFGRPWSAATRMWLMRAFKAREQRCGSALLLRSGFGVQSKWYTTESLLRRGFPELFSVEHEMVTAARDGVARIEHQMMLQDMKLDALAHVVAELKADSERRMV